MKTTWWKEAIVYQIYPRSFLDTTGNGFGDLNGITSKLDYLKSLGVDVLWLSPIFQSPDDDNGYDISDYRNIMEKFGFMDDFDRMLKAAHDRGLKIILDLVVNHTSDEHKWFKESKNSSNNYYRDYYFWRKDKPSNWLSFFGGDAWEYDSKTKAYYLHLFSKKQPDLNWENEQVRKEVYDMMHFWLKKGVDGFRMDVIPMISKFLDFPDMDRNDFMNAINNLYTNGPRLHEFLREMNEQVLSKYDVMSMGEGIGIAAHQGLLYTDELRRELQMVYHFDHMALDWGDNGKFDPKSWKLTEFKHVFRSWYRELGDKGWITLFLDNHDFPRMVSRFGNDKEYRVESAKLLITLLMTLRGTPCIYQGSEIGMTNVQFDSLDDYKDIEIKNKVKEWRAQGRNMEELKFIVHKIARDNARTPLQWNKDMHSGFSKAENIWIDSNPNFTQINVESALENPNSIWYYYKKIISLRKMHKTLVYGNFEEFMSNSEDVYVYRRWDEKGNYLITLNFTNHPQFIDTIPEFEKSTLLIGNYSGSMDNKWALRPWEARVFYLNRFG